MLEIWQRSRSFVSWVRKHRQGWPGLIFHSFQQALAPESSLRSAAVAYFALFSFFPLLVFITVIAGTWLEPILNKSEVIDQFNFVAPALAYILDKNLQRIVGLEDTLTTISLVALLWSSSNIFFVLTRMLDRVWGVHGRRSMWRHRGMAILSVLFITAILMLTTVLHSTVVSFLNVFAPNSLQRFGSLASQLASLSVSIMLFGILYRYLPHIELDWIDVWPGMVGAAILWEVAKRLFFYYATTYLVQPNLTLLIYGSVATIIAFLMWSYISSLIFMFGAYLNVNYCERRAKIAAAQGTQMELQSGVPEVGRRLAQPPARARRLQQKGEP